MRPARTSPAACSLPSRSPIRRSGTEPGRIGLPAPRDLTVAPTAIGSTSVVAGEAREPQTWYRDAHPAATSGSRTAPASRPADAVSGSLRRARSGSIGRPSGLRATTRTPPDTTCAARDRFRAVEPWLGGPPSQNGSKHAPIGPAVTTAKKNARCRPILDRDEQFPIREAACINGAIRRLSTGTNQT